MEARPKAYLAFRVARREFAVEAGCVRGVLAANELAPLPGAQPSIAGTARMAGQPFAVVDLRVRLQLPHTGGGPRPRIVVVEASGRLAGFLADCVSSVLHYRPRDLRRGVLHGAGRSRKLLDVESLLGANDFADLRIAP